MASPVGELNRKRARSEPDGPSSGELAVKRLRDDLLCDSYPDPSNRDLESVIRSLEEEISVSIPISPSVIDLTSDSGESGPELGYLLEASDDELGLPPPETETVQESETGLERIESGPTGIGEFWGFEEEFPSYDPFGFGSGDNYTGSDDYVELGGLFDYSDDVVLDSTDFLWRHHGNGTLPAHQ